MKTIKFRLYSIEILLILLLFFALFALNIDKRIIVLVLLVITFIAAKLLLSKKKMKSIFERQVSILMLIISSIYLGFYYLLGLFYGYVRSKYILSLSSIIQIIIPLALIIIISELLRNFLLSQNGTIAIRGKRYDYSPALVYIAMTLIEVVIYIGIYNMSNMDDFLMVLGLIIFASISCNLLYNYMSKKFGYKPIIIMRLIIGLYFYFIPFIPDVYVFMRIFLRMISPFLVYLILEGTYSRTLYRERRKNAWSIGIMLTVITLTIMLISCQFTYGIIVIGSESMTGSINVGDAVIYKRYNGGLIEDGQVVIFDYNDIKTVHRVVSHVNINGETRYTTKGDFNKNNDDGYRTKDDIDGLVKIKVNYIGLPTLWFRSLFGK